MQAHCLNSPSNGNSTVTEPDSLGQWVVSDEINTSYDRVNEAHTGNWSELQASASVVSYMANVQHDSSLYRVLWKLGVRVKCAAIDFEEEPASRYLIVTFLLHKESHLQNDVLLFLLW
ncbi:hypothetical protein J6590_034477 [Homalodisca vitripennis]|nr:hypothetical protein J6590_034477 [Homalodisca vitripennis]